jgi:hypothetical protein
VGSVVAGFMSKLPHDETSVAAAGAARSPEQAGSGAKPVAEHRRALDRERKRAPSTENQHAPPIEQRLSKMSDAQEFFQIQRFVAACRQQWPGAKIVLRPKQDGASADANAPSITLTRNGETR